MRNKLFILSVYILCFFIILSKSSLFFNNVLSLDEGTYLSIGMLLTKGKLLYRDVYDSKPPLFHFINTFVYFLVGNELKLARIFISVISSFTCVVIYFLVQKYEGKVVGAFSALLFAYYSMAPTLQGFKVLTEPYSTLFGCLALWFFIKSFDDDRFQNSLYSGVLLGAYIMVRLTGALYAFYLLFVGLLFNDGFERYRKSLYLFLGVFVVPLVFLIYFSLNFAASDYLYWIFEPIKGFAEYVDISKAQKTQWFMDFFWGTLPLWFFSFVGLLSKYRDRFGQIVLGWGVFLISFYYLSFLPGFSHYYYEVLPVLVVLGAFGCFSLLNRFQLKLVQNRSLKSILVGLLVLCVVGASFVVSESRSSRLSIEFLSSRDYDIVQSVSSFILENSDPDDEILVFETVWPKIGPYVYYFSERAPSIVNLFFFPWKISDVEVTRVLDSIDRETMRYFVFIGPEPLYPEARFLYDHISSLYRLEYSLDFLPNIYPHLDLDEISVQIFERKVVN